MSGENAGTPTCLHAGCGLPGTRRGFCYRHYSLFSKRIKRDGLSWEEAERLGLCLPRQPQGRAWMRGFSLREAR